MKIKKIFLIGIIILGILTVPSICAAENITADNLGLNETIDSEPICEPTITVPSKVWEYGENNITITTHEKAEINITGAIQYNTTLNAEKTSIPIKLANGTHSIFINYLSNTSNFQKEYNITVLKDSPDWDMNFNFLDGRVSYDHPWDHEFMDIPLTLANLPEGLTGNFTFYCNNTPSITFNAVDYDPNELYFGRYFEPITYVFTLSYSGDDYFKPVNKSKTLTFYIKPPEYKVVAKDITANYPNTVNFKAKLYFDGIHLPANIEYKIKIGSKTYTVKTDSNGVISKKLKLSPGKYTVKIFYDTITVKHTITIKHAVNLKSATVKKSAKKLILQATLKKGKTPLKSKQITFKFNGKTYKAKTSSKGIAKVTIKSSVLKKLKLGKKVTYQATYLKDTVKKTVKVQK